jgi:hypothetical protein
MTLLQVFPDSETLLALEPEELGGALLGILSGSEAFAWLERAGLTMPDFTQLGAGSAYWSLLTKRGRELRTREQVRSYQDAALLPVGLVHAEILPKAHPAFLRGD